MGPHARLVSQDDYPGEWPFGPDDGVLRCRDRRGERIVTIEVRGVTYGLSEAAKHDDYADVREILATDHAGLPFDYSPVLRDGLGLCPR